MLFSPSGSRNRDSHTLGELHTKRQLHALYINNTLIKRVEEARFLGVTIDSKLSWVPHIENLQKKLKCQIGSLNRIKDNVPAHLHNELYHTLFESHLRYGITVWGHGSYKDTFFFDCRISTLCSLPYHGCYYGDVMLWFSILIRILIGLITIFSKFFYLLPIMSNYSLK